MDEASALNYGYDNTSIYSCSWGPPDDGRSMEGPSYIVQKAVVNGILNGRGGKGSVFVFASGNGAAQDDQCNFDGYTNSIYSVTVSAVDYQGLHPYYSEPCAANMVVTYSSGSGKYIVRDDGYSLFHVTEMLPGDYGCRKGQMLPLARRNICCRSKRSWNIYACTLREVSTIRLVVRFI